MTDIEHLKLWHMQDEIISEMRQKRARCSQVCSCYNSEDRDCEIFGGQKIPPSRCGYFLEREVQRRMREKEG